MPCKPLVLSAALALALMPGLSAAQEAKKQDKKGPSTEMHQSMMKGARQSMGMKSSGDIDHDFVTFMRHHHQTGIRMAEQEMRNGKDEKVKELARKIAEGQKEELKELDELAASAGQGSTGQSRQGPRQPK